MLYRGQRYRVTCIRPIESYFLFLFFQLIFLNYFLKLFYRRTAPYPASLSFTTGLWRRPIDQNASLKNCRKWNISSLRSRARKTQKEEIPLGRMHLISSTQPCKRMLIELGYNVNSQLSRQILYQCLVRYQDDQTNFKFDGRGVLRSLQQVWTHLWQDVSALALLCGHETTLFQALIFLFGVVT